MDESVHHDANRNMSAMDMLHTGHLDPSQPIYSTPDHSVHDHSAHDHSAHSGHESQSNVHSMMSHMMSMAFHGGCNETILFDQWTISSTSGLIGSMVVIFLFSALYEGLKYYREYLFWKTYNRLQYRAVTVAEKNVVVNEENPAVVRMVGEVIHKQPPSMFSLMHFFQSILHLLQVTLSFMLMLIFMTYNTWLCISVVVGAACGFFLFGWKKSVIVDVTEHCH